MSLPCLIIVDKQVNANQQNQRRICQQLHQALKVINADYQQIDWEDLDFLNQALTEVIEALERNCSIQKSSM